MMPKRAAAPAEHGGFVHAALTYGSDDELLAVAVPFLREGAAAGEPTLLGIGDRRQRLVLDELGELTGITLLNNDHYRDPFSALRSNQALLARSARRGAARIRMLADVPCDPWRDWFRYEAAINELFSAFPVWGLCAYDARTTPDDVLADVERTHPYRAIAGGSNTRNQRYEHPAALLNDRARAEADPLEALTPDLELVDPTAEEAGRAVSVLAEATMLDRDSADALRLSVGQVVANAIDHGRPPVRLRAWAAPDRVVVTVRDAGAGPADAYVGLLPRDPDADLDNANGLYVVHVALSEVSLFSGTDGFTVRLVQRRSP